MTDPSRHAVSLAPTYGSYRALFSVYLLIYCSVFSGLRSALAAPGAQETAPTTQRATAEHTRQSVIFIASTSTTSLSQTVISGLVRHSHCRLLPIEAIHPLLRQHDAEQKLLPQIQHLREQGHQALLRLDQHQAEQKLDGALKLLERSFIRFYQPALAAEIHVLRGDAALRASRPDLAQQEFVEAHQLHPSLDLDANYSPQLRAAFDRAVRSAPAQVVAPTPAQLAHVVSVVGNVARVVVIVIQPLEATHQLAEVLVFNPEANRYFLVESAPLAVTNEQRAAEEGNQLGRRVAQFLDRSLRPRQAQRMPLSTQPQSHRSPTSPPWYKRWYLWTAVGVALVAATAITVPLTTRRDVVDLDVNWR